MILYLAGDNYADKIFGSVGKRFNRLDSFFYVRKSKYHWEHANTYQRYMLDSGAYTFIMSQRKVKIDIDSFTDEYIDFVKAKQVDHFFEMDVDSVFGYDKVKQLRNRIESQVGRPTIPVFHMNRGLEDWKAMCRDYDYISIGVAGKDFALNDARAFNAFVESAAEFGTKVHGLGISGNRAVQHVRFYSIDSSSWTTGNQFKFLWHFDGRSIRTQRPPAKSKIANQELLARYNFREWLKFATYLEGREVA